MSTLDRVITIQRATEAKDDFGVVTEVWAPLVTLRARMIQASTEEYLKAAGLQGETAVIFRARYFDGVTTNDRVLFEGAAHDIKELKEIGRRGGLEIRTTARVS